jgi:hypothetical protein
MFTRAHHLSQLEPLYTPPPPTSSLLKIHSNPILPCTPQSSKWFSPWGFPTKTLYTFLSSPKRATCLAHLIVLNLICLINTWSWVQNMKLFITICSPKFRVFRDVVPCSHVEVDWHFSCVYCLHHVGDDGVYFHETTWHYIPECCLHTGIHQNTFLLKNVSHWCWDQVLVNNGIWGCQLLQSKGTFNALLDQLHQGIADRHGCTRMVLIILVQDWPWMQEWSGTRRVQ